MIILRVFCIRSVRGELRRLMTAEQNGVDEFSKNRARAPLEMYAVLKLNSGGIV